MRTLETSIPPRGLSIPAVTALDPDGGLIEADQRRLVRFLVQDGRGADVVLVMGTTGEWNRVSAPVRQRAIQVTAEEMAKLDPQRVGRVEAWVGVTAGNLHDTLETLELALDVGADAAVIAPLAIPDAPPPMELMRRTVADFLDARDARIPVYLYDNPDIARVSETHLRTAWVKELSRLDFVRGIKVSTNARRLGHYTKAARHFRDLGAFHIYVGNALYILEMMQPRSGVWGKLVERWNRFLLHDMLPAGVVAGPANLFPREWQRAWQVSCAGDAERMRELHAFFNEFRSSYVFPTGKRSLAALKRGLMNLGVLSSDAVAGGTPALDASQADAFDAAHEALVSRAQAFLPQRWVSDPGCADPL